MKSILDKNGNHRQRYSRRDMKNSASGEKMYIYAIVIGGMGHIHKLFDLAVNVAMKYKR